ncbi:RagB/SusD family nutrient uptake outer membrane protein [Lunatibacter salilacus]|uniref:RagB/SusD family nutrient uptake outer membrane protein n=1 Tax=Lunatibacter salilacus TaxID=2483804 RepID=UPI00131CE3CE|nr:RagB/SusD family nutrient uptake outer membrane protein [Lunatibacter salilacus]
MKAIKIKYENLIFCGLLFFVLGCSDFLEEQDPSNLNPESFYTIPEHAEAAIIAAYTDLRFVGGGAGIFSSNWQLLEAVTGTSTTETAQNSDLNNLYGLIYDGHNLHIVNWWNGLYRVVGQANLVIENVPQIDMDQTRKNQILGEAHFLRAWAYFHAVRMWGDLALITKPQTATSDDFYPVRSSQEEVYNLIVEDLLIAESAGLPWMDGTGRVSQAAAKALLSKVYLTMAGYPLNKGISHYQLAADKSMEIIANPGSINLFDNYADIRNVATDNTIEDIFEIQFLADIAGNPYQQPMLPYYKPISAGAATGIGTTVPTEQFFQSYETGDLRAENQMGFFYTSYFHFGNGDVYELGGPYIFKHFDVLAHGRPGVPGTGRSDLNMPQIRFAEVLLIYAEAQNEVTGPNQGAHNALKRIRDRATLETPTLNGYTQESFREDVWRERWHELCYEGITWFDMVRLRKAYNSISNDFDNFVGYVHLGSNQEFQEKHLLFPVPVPELVNNPNLAPQNPGY